MSKLLDELVKLKNNLEGDQKKLLEELSTNPAFKMESIVSSLYKISWKLNLTNIYVDWLGGSENSDSENMETIKFDLKKIKDSWFPKMSTNPITNAFNLDEFYVIKEYTETILLMEVKII